MNEKKLLPVMYKRKKLTIEYFADFVCYGNIIVELKAIVNLVKAHKAQILNYLKTAKSDVGLLINFGESLLKWERITGFEKKGQSVAADIVI